MSNLNALPDYTYALICGGENHGRVIALPDTAKQILILRNNEDIYCREDVEPATYEEIIIGQIYTKHEEMLWDKKGLSVSVWFHDYPRERQIDKDQKFALIKAHFSIKDVIIHGKNKTYYPNISNFETKH